MAWTGTEPFIDGNGRTMVPLRAIGEALGLDAGWNQDTREASFSGGGRSIHFPIGSSRARTDGGILVCGKEASRMLDILGISETTEREKGLFDASNEVKFVHVYFAFYPYISSNN